MSKRIAKIMFILLVLTLLSSIAFAQGWGEPKAITTRDEMVDNFIEAVKKGDTTAFRLVTYDILAGITVADTSTGCGAGRTKNVIDTLRCEAAVNEVTFMEYLTDGDTSDTSETRKKVITSTLQGLYNLDPRIRLISIEWLRKLRPDGMMFRDVERAVEYETVASSYEKYRPKNVDIPSIDEPGAPGTNIEFDYYYNAPEETINYPFDNWDGTKPDEKIDPIDETGVIKPLTDARPTATQLDARKWGNGNPFDPLQREFEIDTYIDVMTQAGALRRFRNMPDSYLIGYQYRLGTYYEYDYNGWDPALLTDQQREEIEKSMVPIGHGDKYFYRNVYGRDVIGNSWAELIKLREFIVRAIWYQKIRDLELNSLVIISKDTFKTLYLSIDGESGRKVPFLSLNTPTPMLDERHVPVLAQGLLKNPVLSTKWVIARALKDIYMNTEEEEVKHRINKYLRDAKYDALAKDYISGAILHEELITVGKIDLREPNYAIVNIADDGYPESQYSGTFAGGVYIPQKDYLAQQVVVVDTTITGFGIPNDEIIARRYAGLTYNANYDWWTDRANQPYNEIDLIDRVLDSFSFYTWAIDDGDDTDYLDGDGDPIPARSIPPSVEMDAYGKVETNAPVVTYYGNINEYLECKSVYYRYNYMDREPDDNNLPDSSIRYVIPHFNALHYNNVIEFINALLTGDNEVMATVTWDILESAELLTLYRMYQMLGDYNTAREIIFDKSRRVAFFDALQKSKKADILNNEGIVVTRPENQDPIVTNVDGVVEVGDREFFFSDEFTADLLDDIAIQVDLFKEAGSNTYVAAPIKDWSNNKRASLVAATLPGLFNKDPRVRLTAMHWLRRLGPSEEMFDDVRKARGIFRQEDYYTDEEDFDDPYRTDRAEAQIDRVQFLDTNIYHRNDYPDIENDTLAAPLFSGTGKDENTEVRSILYVVSKDFESYIYKRLGLDDLAETVTFYDMKPDYSSAEPNKNPELPLWREDSTLVPFYEIDEADATLLQIVAIANPIYTENRYEFYYKSYGLYQFKSPNEELEKLYRFILREMLVNTIKGGKQADIFVTMPRFNFSVLTNRLDNEYVLRIPMQSFFGFDPEDTIRIENGDYDSSKAFLLPKGALATGDETYVKYPVFKEPQIALIQQGVDNPNFIVQKGTAEFLIRFYNYYSNLEPEIRRDIRDAMFYYKQDDIVVEEVTLAMEAEQPEGRSVIKAGTKLGNEINPGGVRQYKNLPVELRKDIRRTINREIQSFEREIANILGVRRKTSVGEDERLGYFTGDEGEEYVPVKPADEGEAKNEEGGGEGD
jgi:hypothetical protein